MAVSSTILEGSNPLADNTALFLLQLLIIIVVCRLIAIPLGYMRQPRVIAEVIGGIILGKSALSKIPSFKNTIFPDDSIVRLKVIAEFGLILFLFLVGMEIDPKKMFSNLKQSAAISFAGIVLPFAVGIGASKALFDNLMVGTTQPFSSFLIFTGVAMSITAFPVLARILAERKLLQTKVGQITLSSAALDDAIAWCLLILVVAIINNTGNYLMALWVFLTTVAFAVFLYFGVRPVFSKIVSLRSETDHITQLSVFLVFSVVVLSSWFTNAIGVHSMFGGFLAGLIIPHEHGFAIKITEKIEDLVTVLLLPLYFTNSGLNTRIDLLDDGVTWAMVALVIFCACGGKIIGCSAAARFSGLAWRESFTVGVLMNTKGLVEIIVLNLGLSAGVINERVFTVMVVMALVTTFITVPIVSFIYPMKLYITSKNAGQPHSSPYNQSKTIENQSAVFSQDSELRLMICLKNLHSVPSMIALVQILKSAPIDINLYPLRLISLGERNSTIMMATEYNNTIKGDTALNIFKTFGAINRIGFKPMLSVSHFDDFAENILTSANEVGANIIIVPWIFHISNNDLTSGSRRSYGINQYYDDLQRRHLIDQLYENPLCTVVVFIDRGLSIRSPHKPEMTSCSMNSNKKYSLSEFSQTVFIPFTGGEDAREALSFGMYFTQYPGLTVNIIRVVKEISTPLPLKQSDSLETVNMSSETEDSPDDKLLKMVRACTNVSYTELASLNAESSIIDYLSLNVLTLNDLLIVGKEFYDESMMKQFVDYECKSSACIVHRNASTEYAV